jgi:hypothetical protein
MRDLTVAAAHMQALVSPGARVFLLGDSLIPYLAVSTPYLQQIYSTNTLAVIQERRGIEKGGLWGDREMDLWLSKDADYVVVEPPSSRPSRDAAPGADRPIPVAPGGAL